MEVVVAQPQPQSLLHPPSTMHTNSFHPSYVGSLINDNKNYCHLLNNYKSASTLHVLYNHHNHPILQIISLRLRKDHLVAQEHTWLTRT